MSTWELQGTPKNGTLRFLIQECLYAKRKKKDDNVLKLPRINYFPIYNINNESILGCGTWSRYW